MAQYIDKAALIAWIEKRLKEYRTFPDYQTDSNYMELCEILSFLDTLEVKEIDSTNTFIEKACKWLKENAYFYVNDYTGSLNDDMLVNEFHKAMKE